MCETYTTYLLHFAEPISPRHTTQHYIGSCKDLRPRLQEHRDGTGARLTQVAKERGISFQLVRDWAGGRDFERKLKKRKNAKRLCPICNPQSMNLFLEFTLDDVEEIAV